MARKSKAHVANHAALGDQEIEGQDSVFGELSPIGMLCDGILADLDSFSERPDAAKASIGMRIRNVLTMFAKSEDRVEVTKQRNSALKGELRRVTEQLQLLRHEHFGQSSEKDQGDAADYELDFAFEEEPEQKILDERKGKRRRKIPDNLETQLVHHFPPDRTCCSCGCEMQSISSWESTRFRIVPEHVEVLKDVYHTCACNRQICKENKPVSAKTQNYIMKGRSVDPGFAVEAACQKFFEHIPTFRMERRLLNSNLNISRKAIGGNIAHLATHIEPVYEALREHVKAAHAAHMDETPLRVQAPGNGKCETGYLWVICRDERRWNPDAQPAAFYHYAHSRAGIVAENLLSGAALRFLHTDGYSGYNRLYNDDAANDGLSSVRCWAHTRRNFVETVITTKSPFAKLMVKLIKKMYSIELAVVGLLPEERAALRQEKTLPIIMAIRTEAIKQQPFAFGTLKKAINYFLNAFEGLQRFVFDGRLEIDNNPVERCIRGIALTKKNSLFAGGHDAAKVWAVYYTLIESARLNNINPRSYLTWVVGEIERSRGDLDCGLLMPWHCPTGHITN